MEKVLSFINNAKKISRVSELFDNEVGQLDSDAKSELDKWFSIGDACWIKRVDELVYLCVQVTSLINDTSLCYLYHINLAEVSTEYVLECYQNISHKMNVEKLDLGIVYPIAISLGIEKAVEKYVASNEQNKQLWLRKMGINNFQKYNLYTCEMCRLTFENDRLIERCPNCGKIALRKSTNAECECYLRYIQETEV